MEQFKQQQQQSRVPCINIHMTPGRLGLEILLEKCLLWLQQIGRKKKKKISERSRLQGSSRSSSFGALWQVDTAKLCMVLSRWDRPECPPPTPALHVHTHTHTDTSTDMQIYLHGCQQISLFQAGSQCVHRKSNIKRYKHYKWIHSRNRQ